MERPLHKAPGVLTQHITRLLGDECWRLLTHDLHNLGVKAGAFVHHAPDHPYSIQALEVFRVEGKAGLICRLGMREDDLDERMLSGFSSLL